MKERRSLAGFFPWILFVCFGIAVLWVLLSQTSLLRDISRQNDAATTMRTAGDYLTGKVRQSTAVEAGTFGGCDAVVLMEEIENVTYLTRIYCWEGSLRELFSPADVPMEPADGEKLLKMQDMTAEESDGVLKVTFLDETGATETVLLRVGG